MLCPSPGPAYVRDRLRIPLAYHMTLVGGRDVLENGIRCLFAWQFCRAMAREGVTAVSAGDACAASATATSGAEYRSPCCPFRRAYPDDVGIRQALCQWPTPASTFFAPRP